MTFVRQCALAAINFALPPRCAGCGLIVSDDHQLCLPCWGSLTFLTDDGCALCGVPMSTVGQICASCLMVKPDHDGVCAAVVYGDVARAIILKLKHGRRIGLAKTVGLAMARRMPAESALLVPVPLHRWRLWHRGFNQSALIARHLVDANHRLLMLDVLRRDRATPTLGGLGAKARALAVRGVFSVNPAMRERLRGQTVLLIDDVYTSGATANACARILKKAGAARVIVLCWARVIRENQEVD